MLNKPRKAMVFAAGEGRRMLPLTAQTPKPLLPLGDSHLIGQNLKQLAAAGVREVIINTAYLGQKIHQALGDGRGFGVDIEYSDEPYPLETGGALHKALPLIGDAPFLLINADVLSDYPLHDLLCHQLPERALGHLVLVPNPEQHSQGDFAIDEQGQISTDAHLHKFTFSGISLLHPNIIRLYPHAREQFPLREAFNWAIAQGRLSGEVHRGRWLDVGTPARLAQAQTLWMQL
jgi:N-acetyl-alpha-D-muramate 1-phosphate uridylyltransferase